MNRSLLLVAGLAVTAATGSAPAVSQGLQQTISAPSEQTANLAVGYRMSKLIGHYVVNEHNTQIGTIDDLIVTQADKVPFAVLSVGGFLGIDTKFVVVPFSDIDVQDNLMTLRGATKASLEALPPFHYRS